MRLDRLQATAAKVRGLRGAALNEALGELTVEERIAVKHMAASGELATDEVISLGMLRTDRQAPGQGGLAQVGQGGPQNYALDRALLQAGFDLTGPKRYSVRTADVLLKGTRGDVEFRLGLKSRLAELGKLLEDGADLVHELVEVREPVQAQRKTMQASAAKPIKGCKMQSLAATGIASDEAARVGDR